MNCAVEFELFIVMCIFLVQCTCQSCPASPGRTVVQKVFFSSQENPNKAYHMNKCRKYGGTMAKIQTLEDEMGVKKLLTGEENLEQLGIDYVMIGGLADSRAMNIFRWENGPLVGNSERPIWKKPEPNRNHENCLSVPTNSNMSYADFPCGFESHGVCEAFPQLSKEHLACEDTLCICPGMEMACKCRDSCVRAYVADICDYSPCRFDRYGSSCEFQCRCKDKRACDMVSGKCPAGCQYGWKGESCNQTACPLNRFGGFCEGFCYCRQGDQCNITNGDCYNGCEEYAYGPSCENSGCKVGKYGPQCTKDCSYCGSKVPCSRDKGVCSTRKCPGKYRGGPFCMDIFCPVGLFGSNCTQKCRCSKQSPCDINTGKCLFEEVPKELLPENACPEGLWGNNCNITCMDKSCQGCLKTNGGYCMKCRDGYYLTATKDCEMNKKDSFVLMILVVILCLLLLILLALIPLLLKRSKKKEEEHAELEEEEQDMIEESEEEEGEEGEDHPASSRKGTAKGEEEGEGEKRGSKWEGEKRGSKWEGEKRGSKWEGEKRGSKW
ncbi:multiple epidermal growth factor-like domains protein 10, partial [Aplysia californica]|uniref:Multiple epidermal growth factor-like domains protein 10 n=1 Tax=Aplysia californica TaxID=6500 RepID=A0ABM0K6F8_APLCA